MSDPRTRTFGGVVFQFRGAHWFKFAAHAHARRLRGVADNRASRDARCFVRVVRSKAKTWAVYASAPVLHASTLQMPSAITKLKTEA